MNTWAFLAVAVVFVVLAILLGRWFRRKVLGDRITEPTPEQFLQMQAAQAAAKVVAAVGTLPPRLPLTLRLGFEAMWPAVSRFVGWAAAALVLAAEPTLLWSPWLAWPVALVAALLAVWAALDLRSLLGLRLVADADGVQVHQGQTLKHRAAWAEVRAVRLIEILVPHKVGWHWWGSEGTRVARASLSFDGAHGQPLFSIDEPLRPQADYQALLQALPLWTGAAVLREAKKS